MLEKILKDVDQIIEFYNSLECEIVVYINLRNRDACIYSLSMIKEKHKCLSQMKDEFEKAKEVIDNFRI